MLDLDHRALAGLVDAVIGLGDDAVEARRPRTARATRRRASRSRVIGVRWTGGFDVARAAARAARAARACGAARTSCAVDGQQIERDERRRRLLRQLRDARRGRVQAQLQRVEVEAVSASRSRSRRRPRSRRAARASERVVQLGEVAIERPQVAALDEDVVVRRETRSRGSRPTSARRASRSPAGMASASFASIGSIGGSSGNALMARLMTQSSLPRRRPRARRRRE